MFKKLKNLIKLLFEIFSFFINLIINTILTISIIIKKAIESSGQRNSFCQKKDLGISYNVIVHPPISQYKTGS